MIKNKTGKLLSVILAAVLILSPLTVSFAFQSATENNSKSRDIALVFDNSAAMYAGTDSWAGAKYALEVFASMLDYNAGDKLTIYPLWAYSTANQVPDNYEEGEIVKVNPYSIGGFSDNTALTLNFFYTIGTDGTHTHFEDVPNIFKSLKKSKSNEKILIFLMASAFTSDSRKNADGTPYTGEKTYNKIKSLKESYADELTIEYIELGDKITEEQSVKPYSDGKDFNVDVVKKASGLADVMVGLCNKYHNRSEMPSEDIGKGVLNVETSMKNLVIYLPDNSASFSSLSSEGTQIKPNLDSKAFKYSTNKFSHGKYVTGAEKVKKGTNPKGRTYIFRDLKAGEYAFTSSGKVKIYYEPDIEVNVRFYTTPQMNTAIYPNRSGFGQTLPAGTYYVSASLVDRQTGLSVDNSHLISVTSVTAGCFKMIDGKKSERQSITPENPELKIEAGQKYFFDINIKYLNGCKIGTSLNPTDYSYTGVDNSGIATAIDFTQKNHIRLGVRGWDPVEIKLTKNGTPFTSDMLALCRVETECSEDIYISSEPNDKNGSYMIYVGKNNLGKYQAPFEGDYLIDINICSGSNGMQFTESYSVDYSVRNVPGWLIYVIIAAAVGAAVAVYFIFFNKKLQTKLKQEVAKKEKEKAKVEEKKGEDFVPWK